MTTLSDRPNTALLVIDVQQGVVADAHQRDAVVANVSALVNEAREGGVQIVWFQHFDEQLEKGSRAWEYVPELARRESDGARPHRGSDRDQGCHFPRLSCLPPPSPALDSLSALLRPQ